MHRIRDQFNQLKRGMDTAVKDHIVVSDDPQPTLSMARGDQQNIDMRAKIDGVVEDCREGLTLILVTVVASIVINLKVNVLGEFG